MKLLYLRDKIPWFGSRTGYELLPDHMLPLANCRSVSQRAGLLARYLGGSVDTIIGRQRRGAVTASELELVAARTLWRPALTHILYAEQHLRAFSHWRGSRVDLVATIHLPRSQWHEDWLAQLRKLKSAIILYQADREFFGQYVQSARVEFVRHGVDTEFFHPRRERVTAPRILYSGLYLRNTAMLARCMSRLLELRSDLEFDLLVPLHARKTEAFSGFASHPRVRWHAGLDDFQLRALYQQSALLMLPMSDSGANTAIVEALASGIPIVTTDVGGVRDYGGGDAFPVVPNDDDDALIHEVLKLLDDASLIEQRSESARAFAQRHLAWPQVADAHLNAYSNLMAG